jgi:hypothetical protein
MIVHYVTSEKKPTACGCKKKAAAAASAKKTPAKKATDKATDKPEETLHYKIDIRDDCVHLVTSDDAMFTLRDFREIEAISKVLNNPDAYKLDKFLVFQPGTEQEMRMHVETFSCLDELIVTAKCYAGKVVRV